MRAMAQDCLHLGSPSIGGSQSLGEIQRRFVSQRIGNDDEYLLSFGQEGTHIVFEEASLGDYAWHSHVSNRRT